MESASWVGVVMATVALVGTATERVINFLSNREKIRSDTAIALQTAASAAKIASLEEKVASCDGAHSAVAEKLESCEQKHQTVELRLSQLEQATKK